MQISYHDYNYFVCTRVLCGQVHRRYEKKRKTLAHRTDTGSILKDKLCSST